MIKNLLGKMLLAVAAAALWSCGGVERPVEYVAVKIDGSELWSIIDAKSGEVVCKDEFKASGVMTDGEMLYLSLEDGTKEVYNINNVKTPVASKLVDVAPFNGNDVTVAVKEGKAPCIIDREGKQVAQLPNSVTQVGNFCEGLAPFCQGDSLWGYIDTKGKVVINPKYDAAEFFTDGLAAVGVGKGDDMTVKFIDKDNKVKFTIKKEKYKLYDSNFREGYLPVVKNEKIVLLDKEGNEAVKNAKMEEGYGGYIVCDGKFAFCKDGELGLMNVDGEVLVRSKYEELWISQDGTIVACLKDGEKERYGIIDDKGEEVLPFDYDDIRPLMGTGNMLVKEGKTWALVNKEGKEISKDTYDDVSYVLSGKYPSRMFVRSNYFDAEGNAALVANEITVDSFFGVKAGVTAADLIASGVTNITGEASNYSYQPVLSVTRQLGMLGSVEASITFTDGITSPIKEIEYGYWYNYENIVGYEFNKSSVPMVAEAVVSVGPQFANQRDKFMDELCKKITGLGFVSGGVSGDTRNFKLVGKDGGAGRLVSVEPSGEDGVNVHYIYNCIF